MRVSELNFPSYRTNIHSSYFLNPTGPFSWCSCTGWDSHVFLFTTPKAIHLPVDIQHAIHESSCQDPTRPFTCKPSYLSTLHLWVLFTCLPPYTIERQSPVYLQYLRTSQGAIICPGLVFLAVKISRTGGSKYHKCNQPKPQLDR